MAVLSCGDACDRSCTFEMALLSRCNVVRCTRDSWVASLYVDVLAGTCLVCGSCFAGADRRVTIGCADFDMSQLSRNTHLLGRHRPILLVHVVFPRHARSCTPRGAICKGHTSGCLADNVQPSSRAATGQAPSCHSEPGVWGTPKLV